MPGINRGSAWIRGAPYVPFDLHALQAATDVASKGMLRLAVEQTSDIGLSQASARFRCIPAPAVLPVCYSEVLVARRERS
jgi:hypothetical protein